MTDLQTKLIEKVRSFNTSDVEELEEVAELTLQDLFKRYVETLENKDYHEDCVFLAEDEEEKAEEQVRVEINDLKSRYYLEELSLRFFGNKYL